MLVIIAAFLLYTIVPVDSSDLLSCHGDFQPEHLGQKKTTEIYIPAGVELLNITCVLTNLGGDASKAEWLTIDNMAHQLILKLWNSTWIASFVFPHSEKNQWELSINIAETFLIGSEHGTDLLEDLMYTVEIDTAFSGSHGTIMFYHRQPLVLWAPGQLVNPATSIWDQSSPSDILAVHSPCSGSVWLIAPVVPTGLYLGVAVGSFLEETVKWYNLTSSIAKACNNSTPNSAMCDGDVELKEIVLTNYNILLVTSVGLYVSSKMHIGHAISDDDLPLLSWTRISDGDSQMQVFYSPICLDAQRKCVFRDQIDITYIRLGADTLICSGYGDFLSNSWTCRKAEIPNQHGAVVHIVFNRHTGSAIILQWNEIVLQATVTVMLSSLDLTILPTVYLPPGVRFTHVKLHPHTMAIFLLGDELWYSYDQGANFYPMWQPKETEMVRDVVFNMDSVHTELLAITNDKLHRTVNIAYGMLESHRVKHVFSTSRPATFYLRVNAVKAIEMLSIINGHFVSEDIGDITPRLEAKLYINASLAIEFTSEQLYTAYELDTSADGYALQRYHVGMLLVHRKGGKAKILSYHKKDHSVEILLAVIRSFLTAADSREAILISNSLFVTKYNSTMASITLLDGHNLPVSAWTQDDVEKSLVLALQSNYLITSFVNSTTVIAMAASGYVLTQQVAAGHWRIIDLSVGSWWLEEDDCKRILHVNSEVPQSMLTLDLGSAAKFHIVSSLEFEDDSYFTELRMDYSNPFLFIKVVEKTDHGGYTQRDLTLTDKYYKQSVSSLLVYHPYTSLLCPELTRIYTILLCCSCHKRMVFNYPQTVTPQMLLADNMELSPVLYQLPVNYRPPSALGIAIPLSSNIYNANPDQPLFNSKYKRSKDSAVFKYNRTCLNAACGCTAARNVSRLVAYSDCISRVYKLRLPGQLYLCFAFELLNYTTNEFFLTSIGDYYIIAVTEVNARKDFQIEYQDQGSGGRYISPDVIAKEGVGYNTRPYNLRLKMFGSGLYHFQSTVPSYMSYCDLHTEFLVYVDKAPVPYPFLFLTDFGVNMGMGFVMFLVYAVYRLNRSYHKQVEKVHRTPTCSHALINSWKNSALESSDDGTLPNVMRHRKSHTP